MRDGRPGWRAGALAILFALVSSASEARSPADASDVVVQALALLGTPYRFGGASPTGGFDCSGLVRHVFAQALSQDLPRRSEDMQRVGQQVARSELQPGDLVFFSTRGHAFSHVAIYIGNDRFVHAPAGRGVVRIEALTDRYWSTRFDGGRRLIGAVPAESVASASAYRPGDDPPRP